jgi:hypothetical protein
MTETVGDWTKDPSGRSNASREFLACVDAVATILHSHRLGDSVESTARVIVARLAFERRLAPLPEPPDAD